MGRNLSNVGKYLNSDLYFGIVIVAIVFKYLLSYVTLILNSYESRRNL